MDVFPRRDQGRRERAAAARPARAATRPGCDLPFCGRRTRRLAVSRRRVVVLVALAAPAVPLWIVFPVGWTALEWLIGHLGDVRFPWLGLGTSLADAPVLVQWADIAGARGVTLWVAWCNVVIVDAATDVRGAWYVVRRLAPVLGTALLALAYGAWRMKTLPIRDVGVVGMVQPNEGFKEKFDSAHADSVMSTLFALSRGLV